MIGLLLIYYIGKQFYELAGENNKSKWGFAILGIVSYYAGTFIAGIVMALIYEIGMSKSIDDINDVVLGLIALPFGVLACWGLYKVLKSQWSKQSTFSASEEILDANFIPQQSEESWQKPNS